MEREEGAWNSSMAATCNVNNSNAAGDHNLHGKEVRNMSFTEDVTGIPETAILIKPLPTPMFKGGNIIKEVDDEDSEKGLQQCQFYVSGRIIL